MNRGACGTVLLLFAAGAVGPVGAEPPDCTGISNVHNAGPDLSGELTTVRVASGLSAPVFVTHAPGDASRLFIVEQAGKIKVLKNGVLLGTPFLDVDPLTNGGGERGLLGLAFHPDYQQNGYFFLYYTATDGAITIARYQ